jgi:hypothetical protein
MGGSCSTYEEEDKCVRNLIGKSEEEILDIQV